MITWKGLKDIFLVSKSHVIADSEMYTHCTEAGSDVMISSQQLNGSLGSRDESFGHSTWTRGSRCSRLVVLQIALLEYISNAVQQLENLQLSSISNFDFLVEYFYCEIIYTIDTNINLPDLDPV